MKVLVEIKNLVEKLSAFVHDEGNEYSFPSREEAESWIKDAALWVKQNHLEVNFQVIDMEISSS